MPLFWLYGELAAKVLFLAIFFYSCISKIVKGPYFHKNKQESSKKINHMFRQLSRFIIFRILKWQIILPPEPLPDKYVFPVVPHTSSWDFPMGLMIRSIMKEDIKYVAKHTLFRPPFGTIFRWFGGYPVDRRGRHNFVDSVVDIFNEKEEFKICLAAEGTRKKVEKLKTGFYYIAKGANVPIVMGRLDYAKKTFTVSEPFYPTDDVEADMQVVDDYFKSALGYVPEYSYGYKS